MQRPALRPATSRTLRTADLQYVFILSSPVVCTRCRVVTTCGVLFLPMVPATRPAMRWVITYCRAQAASSVRHRTNCRQGCDSHHSVDALAKRRSEGYSGTTIQHLAQSRYGQAIYRQG